MELQGFGTPRKFRSGSSPREQPLIRGSPEIIKKVIRMTSDSTFNFLNGEPHNLEELKELQGEVRIETFLPLRRNWYKTLLLLPLVALATGLLILIVMRKKKDISALLMYQQCQMAEATHVLIIGNDKSMEIADHTQPLFFYRKLKYMSRSSHPYPIHYSLADSTFFGQADLYKQYGLSNEQVIQSRLLFGFCQHTVEVPTLPSYLADEMLGIFYILQYITCAIYILEDFIFFGVTLISVSFISTIINYFLLRSSYLKIKELAEHYTTVRVVRGGQITEVSSIALVPGDIFQPEGKIQCDCVLVQGQLYMNEASLTGESVPIAKTPAKSFEDTKQQTKWLFEGSEVVEARGKPLALVVNTGYTTRRGRIFRKILYRQPKEPEFYWTAFLFLLEMLAYCTIIYIALIPIFISNQISIKLMILRFFDMLGWAIPPSFPIAFNVCYSFSLYRLRKQGIFGTQPYKTIVSGKVTTVCFDKTGTLTQNAMQLNSIIKFTEPQYITIHNTQKLSQNDLLNKLMASCHTVRKVQQQFLGDELDLRMFLYSGFKYQVPDNDPMIALILTLGQQRLEVLRINQFESKFQSMSVLVRDCKTHKCYIFVKGAPQKMQNIALNKVQNYDEILSNVSLAGLRCLGIAYREVANVLEWLKCDRLKFETDLTLLGLVTFDNKLKEDTAITISNLMKAQIECRVITGDNIYIAVETATRTGIIGSTDQVLILRGDKQNKQTQANDDYIAEKLRKKQDGEIIMESITVSKQYLLNQNTFVTAIDNSFLTMCQFIPKNAKIFARITPESKALVVRKLIQMKKVERKLKSKWYRMFGRTLQKIAMVGDGANDIMAIKQADLGIGISDTDSSFAANFSISKLLHVDYIMREGKSTLSIIIDIFRYYGSMSIVKYIGNMILVWDKASFNDNQFTYLNYGSTIEIVGLLCLTKPTAILSQYLPNDNLMGLQNRLIFIGFIVIPVSGLITIMAIVTNNSVFVPNPAQTYDNFVFSCVTNTAIFLPSHLFYIWSTFWNYTSQPWKQPIYKNYILFGWLMATIIINSVLYFFTSSLNPFFLMVPFDKTLEAILFGVTYGFVILGFLWRLLVNCLQLHKSI